jgi:hypothetical protein
MLAIDVSGVQVFEDVLDAISPDIVIEQQAITWPAFSNLNLAQSACMSLSPWCADG